MHVGRNAPCPCGSGKKFKNCCFGKESRTKGLTMLFIAIASIAVIGLITIFATRNDPQTAVPAGAAAQRPTPGAPQPGPAPPGKVWSQEHGHWHDVAPNSPTTIPVTGQPAPQQTFTAAPQPPGPAPAGKVWSVEHGHWHDIPK